MRWRRYGDPLYVKYNRGVGDTIEERFWNRVDKTSSLTGCWLWLGKPRPDGYGQLGINGERWLTHIYSWFLAYGTRPTQFLLHSCDNPPCVNPDHLREGTQKENIQDAVVRRRIAYGERHGRSVLKEWQAKSVIEMVKQNIAVKNIAQTLNITESPVYLIKNNTTWRHLDRN